jgi:hypothetical protein
MALKSYAVPKSPGSFDRLAPPECPEIAPLWQK